MPHFELILFCFGFYTANIHIFAHTINIVMIFLLQKEFEDAYLRGEDVKRVDVTNAIVIDENGQIKRNSFNNPVFKGPAAVTYAALLSNGRYKLIEEKDADPLMVEKAETTNDNFKKKRKKKNEFSEGTGIDTGDSGDIETGDTE